MRNPVKYRNLNLILALTCAATLAALGLIATQQQPVPKWVIVTATMLVMPMVAGLIAALIYAQGAKGMSRLLAGKGVKARWQVDPQLWQAFVPAEAAFAKEHPQYTNALRLDRDRFAQNFEVVLGDEAILVDGDFHDIPTAYNDCWLRLIQLQPGPPAFVNMHIDMTYVTRYGRRTVHHALRFPVTESARTQAAAVLQEYHAQAVKRQASTGSLVQRYPRQVRNTCLVLLVLATTTMGFGLLLRQQPQLVTPDFATGMAIVSGVVMAMGLLLGTISHFVLRKQRRQHAQRPVV